MLGEAPELTELIITSPVFAHNSSIPAKYTCDGENVNPPLTINGIPEGTRSLVLIVDDPDAPMGTWVHWVVWSLTPKTKIEENMVSENEGLNDFRRQQYGGPCPPHGTHRYFFKVYALDTVLEMSPDSRKKDVEKAMTGHVLAKGEIVGLYRRR